jgi:predicted negative regulator of RcsB-dependent stress response
MATKPLPPQEPEETKITAFDSEDAVDALTVIFAKYRRALTIGVVAIVGAVGGWWVYQRSVVLKEQRGEKAYFEALRAVMGGNAALAQSDLNKVITRYGGTMAGAQATLSLAQVLYDQGKYQDGINVLSKGAGDYGKSPYFGSAYFAMIAAGQEQLKKFDLAAEQYLKAADAARFQAEKDSYRASAARAFMAAGKNDQAKVIWTDLAKDPSNFLAGEAKIRLGEISAAPAGRV